MAECNNGLSMDVMIEQEISNVYAEMAKYDKRSEDYRILCQRALELTEQSRNEVQKKEMKAHRWVPYAQIFGNVAGSALGAIAGQWFNRKTVNDVLDCERDGHIVSSKSTSFIQKPRS